MSQLCCVGSLNLRELGLKSPWIWCWRGCGNPVIKPWCIWALLKCDMKKCFQRWLKNDRHLVSRKAATKKMTVTICQSQRWRLEMFCFFEPTAKNPKKDKEKHEILTFVKPKPTNFLHFCLKKWLKWLFYYQNSCRLISCQSTYRCSSSFILKLQYIWYLDIKTCGTTQSQCITARSAQSLWLLKITSVN